MAPVTHRRVHLGAAAVALVAVRRFQEQVVRRHLGGAQIAQVPLPQQVHLFGGAQVQHVHLATGLLGKVQQTLGGAQRAEDIADIWMLGNTGVGIQVGVALPEARLVLSVHGYAPAARAQHPLQGGVVRDQQVSGGRAHEHLDAGTTRQLLPLGELLGVFCGGAQEECVVGMGAALGQIQLLLQEVGIGGGGPGVGHLQEGGDAASYC